MPQLWTETFVTQYSWLLINFIIVYFFIKTYLIPFLSTAFKARNYPKISSVATTEEKKDDINYQITLINEKSLISSNDKFYNEWSNENNNIENTFVDDEDDFIIDETEIWNNIENKQ